MLIRNEKDLDQFSELINPTGAFPERMEECKHFVRSKLLAGCAVYLLTDCDKGLGCAAAPRADEYQWSYYSPDEWSDFLGYALIAALETDQFKLHNQDATEKRICQFCGTGFRISIAGYSVCECEEGLGAGDGSLQP